MKKFALSRLNAAVIKGLCYSSMAATLAVAPHTLAQEEESDETASVERVMVTGSRIARDPNLASPSPVQAIEAKDIRNSGEFSITDIVNDVPALFSSTGSENSKDTTGYADGTNVLNLRGLGENRTLVLVNGKRHVPGVEGTGAVDVGSIPTRLIKSVEVLTGGASAIYGADAVTGVVNFILDDQFEGFEFDAQTGISSEGDSQQTQLSATYGFNFNNDKGNFVVSVEYAKDEGLRAGERDDGLWIGSGQDGDNPALRFQQGEINGNTPHLAAFYSPSNDRVPFGLNIPSMSAFIANYEATFGVTPNLTQAEIALFSRAANAPGRAVLPGYNFGITSGTGMIIPGNPYTFAGFDPGVNIDLNNNGIPDCYDSFTGYNSSFGSEAFGVIGGCWFVNPNGTYRPVNDGIISSTLNSFGGDGSTAITNPQDFILIPEEKVNVNLLTSYDLTDSIRFSGELKYYHQEVNDVTLPTSFWDLLFGAPDNPYLPEFIRPVAEQTGGVAITIDPTTMIGPGNQETERDTIRLVLGLEGEMDNGWTWEASAVWGKFKRETQLEDQIIVDRFFSAIDAVSDANGNPACRVEVDTSASMTTTPFELPAFDPGYYSFTPGQGQCQPLNIWAGDSGISQSALDWVTTTTWDRVELEQTVISGSIAGDMDSWFELPAGSILFSVGAEYREEKSTAEFDPWTRGVIPSTGAQSGTNIGDISGNNSLVFDPAIPTRNETGRYDVSEVFLELQLPLLEGVTFADRLDLELAGRYSDYSSVGKTETWKANLMWSPMEDLTVRTSFSRAVRAPNITELFGPVTGITVSKDDEPCDVSVANTTNIQNNCETDLLANGVASEDIRDADGNYIWANPLTARFSGTTSGNQDLDPEKSDSTTIGFVYQPSWLDGFDLTIDYWEIELKEAIDSPAERILLKSCYSGATLNPTFCDLFTRINDPASNAVGGLNFIENKPINFVKRETSGYDFAMGYKFNIEEHELSVRVAGTKVNELNNFTDPTNPSFVDYELREVNRPEWAGNIYLDWTVGDLSVSWQTQYMGEQGLTGIEVDDVMGEGTKLGTCIALGQPANPEIPYCAYGSGVMQDESLLHDISATFQVNDEIMVYGGIKNITDEDPFITDFAFPASPRGRFFYIGLNFRLD